jgi:hypothetical protein
MNHSIPANSEEIMALRQKPVDEETIAVAIAGLVRMARSQGQTLEDLTAEVLEDDPILDRVQRRWLSQIVTQAWTTMP